MTGGLIKRIDPGQKFRKYDALGPYASGEEEMIRESEKDGGTEMDLLELMRCRRSIRRYTDDIIPEEKLEKILQVGLLSPSSRSIRPWEFIVVQKKETLEDLANCRAGGAAKMLSGANCAIVVIGDSIASDVWVEDCSIAMANMHLMAAYLGVGSCWIQGRLRSAGELTTDAYVRNVLRYPENYTLEAILSLGIPAADPKPYSLEELPGNKIHQQQF